MKDSKHSRKLGRSVAAVVLCLLFLMCSFSTLAMEEPVRVTEAEGSIEMIGEAMAAPSAEPTDGTSAEPSNEPDIIEDPLSLWTEDAAAKTALISFMETVTDESSADYIPADRRVAVFDLDGTLFCETDPNYFDYCLLKYRVLDDPDYKDQASDFEREVALKIQEQNETGASFEGLEVDHGKAVASAFAGMTPEEFNAYIQEFKQQPMPSYDGMNRGDGWYLPMLQVVDYLKANDFTVYIVSGTDRFIVRGIADGSPLGLPPWQIIGSDETLVATDQGETDGLSYVYDEDDALVLGGDFVVKNLKMNKVTVIAQEIGVQPVLSFGNSTGDSSMAAYVTSGNPYRSLAFMLCCDDTERENGNVEKADKMFDLCGTYGWVPVSMKNDWTTIYGDGVTYLGVPVLTEDYGFADEILYPVGFSAYEGGSDEVTCGILEINDFGNVILDIAPEELNAKGYEAGDFVTVTIGDETWQMPYGTGYSDVDPGYMVLVAKTDSLVLAVNQKSFAEATGLTEDNEDMPIMIRLEEKGGYLRQYEVRNMSYSDEREDYASDEEFANFRNVVMGDIPAGVLYRSASGIIDDHGRPAFVNALCETAGIRTVIDLAQTTEDIEALAAETEAGSFYLELFSNSGVVANGSLGVDMTSEKFKTALAADLQGMLSQEAPYIIQCAEGKDRTGAVVMILEALMGASYDEMLEDYMTSFVNYYHLEKGDERYQAILDGNAAYLFMTLSGTEHVSDMEQAGYQTAAEQYLKDAGLSSDEITQLKACLSEK